MATVQLDINYATPPYEISVKKENEGYERFRGYSGNTLTFEPATDGVAARYNVIVKDSASPRCVQQSYFEVLCGNGGGGGDPEFSAVYLTPYCNQGGGVTDGVVNLTGVVNGTRYKLQYNTASFTENCSQSDGTINGGSASITVIAPNQGSTRKDVLRVYNGSGCDAYTDFVIDSYVPNCGTNAGAIIVLDMRYNSANAGSGGCKDQPRNNMEFYIQSTTPGVSENSQRATSDTSGAGHVVPNGNDVPNVMLVAAPEISCGPASFKRLQVNLAYLKAKYPNIDEFTFDVAANLVVNGNVQNPTFISGLRNTFVNVRMIKKPVGTEADGVTPDSRDGTDAGRSPWTTTQGSSASIQVKNYPVGGVGFVKIGTLKYKFSEPQATATTWVYEP